MQKPRNGLFAAWWLVLLAGTLPATATNHLTQIDEVMAGALGRPEIQFIEMRMFDCSQNQWGGVTRLDFFDAAGNPSGQFVIPSNPRSDCAVSGQSVLIGTQAFADLASAPEPDFIMPPLLVPGSGKVCFRGIEGGFAVNLCLTYGSFSGATEQASSFNAPALSGLGLCSLRRVAFFNDFGGPNFNEDFALTTAAPRNNAGQSGSVVVPPRFNDVPPSSPFFPFVEGLFNAGITGGCGNGAFCPEAAVSRESMSVLLLRALEGPGFQPPACTVQVFNDVPCSSPFSPWINEMAERGLSEGCGGGNFCPQNAVTREQMAVFLLLASQGLDFSPPACTSQVFNDVPCSSPFAPWINELAARGISGGCGGGDFCPGNPVTRAQMAVFLSTAFGLPVPTPATCSSIPPPPPPDDHGNTPQTATPITPGGSPLQGQISPSGDVDVFSFQAAAGQLFQLETFDVGSLDTTITVLAPDGVTVLAFNDDNGFSFASFVEFTAPSTGTFFARIASFNGSSSGSYRLRIIGPILDDHGNTAAAATTIPLGHSLTPGVIERSGDVDFFSFPVAAGQAVVVETLGSDPQMHSGLTVFAQDGVTTLAFGARGEAPAVARALLIPSSGGTFFARVAHSNFGTGSYGILVRPVVDDHGNTAATATPLSPAAAVTGELLASDVDFFSFTAQAGQIFSIEIAGLHGGNGIVLSFLGPGETNFRDFESLFDLEVERFTLIATEPGTYFVRADNSFFSGSSYGLYRITLQGPIVDDHGNSSAQATPITTDGVALSGQTQYEGDGDFFSFHANAGEAYRLAAEGTAPGSFPAINVFDTDGSFLEGSTTDLVFVAEKSGTFFAAVIQQFFSGVGPYRFSVQGPIPDDHGNLAVTATPLVAGAPALDAELEFFNDRDFFSFPAQAGQTFLLKAGGTDLRLQVIGMDGQSVLDATSFGEPALLLFTAPATGTFFARVRHLFSDGGGSYWISLTEVPADDHGNTLATATLLTRGASPAGGTFEVEGDVDFFAFDANSGETVVVETSDLGLGADTVLTLFNGSGSILAEDDDSGGSLASRITFTAPSTGRFTVRVRDFSFGTGTYRIAVRNP